MQLHNILTKKNEKQVLLFYSENKLRSSYIIIRTKFYLHQTFDVLQDKLKFSWKFIEWAHNYRFPASPRFSQLRCIPLIQSILIMFTIPRLSHHCTADEFVTVNVPDSASKPGIIIASSLEEHVVGWTRYHFSSSLLLQTNEPETSEHITNTKHKGCKGYWWLDTKLTSLVVCIPWLWDGVTCRGSPDSVDHKTDWKPIILKIKLEQNSFCADLSPLAPASLQRGTFSVEA